MTPKIDPIAPNVTKYESPSGAVILFSYKTAVAVNRYDGKGWTKPPTHYSRTTSKHINQHTGGAKPAASEEEFAAIVAEASK